LDIIYSRRLFWYNAHIGNFGLHVAVSDYMLYMVVTIVTAMELLDECTMTSS